MMRFFYLLLLFCAPVWVFSQTNISGKITDEEGNTLSSVFVLNITRHTKVISTASGEFSIEAEINDDVRFLKDGYYRADRIVKNENLANPMNISLTRAETLIPEVEIEYHPTGNLDKDSKHLNDSKKVTALKSNIGNYLKSPLTEPLPKNSTPKSFQPHDFGEGQVDLIKTLGAAVGLIKKIASPKITASNYVESQQFLERVKEEIDLSFLQQYAMSEDKIDHFLAYAEQLQHLSKRFRKNFKKEKILSELKYAFMEYAKIYPLND